MLVVFHGKTLRLREDHQTHQAIPPPGFTPCVLQSPFSSAHSQVQTRQIVLQGCGLFQHITGVSLAIPRKSYGTRYVKTILSLDSSSDRIKPGQHFNSIYSAVPLKNTQTCMFTYGAPKGTWEEKTQSKKKSISQRTLQFLVNFCKIMQ